MSLIGSGFGFFSYEPFRLTAVSNAWRAPKWPLNTKSRPKQHKNTKLWFRILNANKDTPHLGMLSCISNDPNLYKNNRVTGEIPVWKAPKANFFNWWFSNSQQKINFRHILQMWSRHTVLFIGFTDVQCPFSMHQIMPGGKHVKDIAVFVKKVQF